jgi:hypothetical protein
MASVIENYSKFEVRALVRFLRAEGLSQNEILSRLVSVYGQNVFSQKEVFVWCNKFKNGWLALHDDPEKHRGAPRTSHSGENCVIVEGLISEDRRVQVCEIAEWHELQKVSFMKLRFQLL